MNTVPELSADEAAEADALRAMMVGELRNLGAIGSESVADAVRVVPRHLFAPPNEPLNRVYAPTTAIVTKRNADGAATSSLSELHIQATMLEQAEIRPGMRVLEIGTGGYNAALIAELAGEAGQVTSVDIDADIVANARDLGESLDQVALTSQFVQPLHIEEHAWLGNPQILTPSHSGGAVLSRKGVADRRIDD